VADVLLARGSLPDDPAALVRRLLDVAQHLGGSDSTGTPAPPG
jgi:hypothetical protein